MKNRYFIVISSAILLASLVSCNKGDIGPLPYIGDRKDLDGTTIEHKIRPFSFINQEGETVTNDTYKNKIHIVDFFFTSCPAICPYVTAQMKRIQDHVSDYGDVMLISHTVDPKRDSVGVLKEYADKIGADPKIWHFLTGSKDKILEMANEDYFVAAHEDEYAPGGFDHSGKILLLDKQAKIRGFCDGMDTESVSKFIKTIDYLRTTYE